MSKEKNSETLNEVPNKILNGTIAEIDLLSRKKGNFNVSEEIYRIYNKNPQKFMEDFKSDKAANFLHQLIRTGYSEFIFTISEIHHMNETVSRSHFRKAPFKNVKDIGSVLDRQICGLKLIMPIKNAIFKLKNIHNFNLLGCSIFYEKYSIVEHLIKNGANINCSGHPSEISPLMLSTFNKDKKIFFFLLENKANIHFINESEETVLHYAVRRKSLDFVKKLLELGANVNQENTQKFNALTLACSQGNLTIVKVLMEHARKNHIKLKNIEYATSVVSGIYKQEILELLEKALKFYEVEELISVIEAAFIGMARPALAPQSSQRNIFTI